MNFCIENAVLGLLLHQRQLSCMYNVSEGINNAHFKLYPDIAQDVTPSAEGFVEWKPEGAHQYGT